MKSDLLRFYDYMADDISVIEGGKDCIILAATVGVDPDTALEHLQKLTDIQYHFREMMECAKKGDSTKE